MRRILPLLLGLYAATAAFGAESEDQAAVERPYAHLQYVGFYASAMGQWNFTQDLAPFTNLTWIHLGGADDPASSIPAIVERLREARAAGVAAALSIEPFLFRNARGVPRPDGELEDLLVELRAQIEAAELIDTVAMIYPKDEPFRQFVDARDPSFIEQYVTGEVYEDVHRDLVHVNEWVKVVFPEKPIGVILSGYDLYHRFFSIPENYDWVGFNCYDSVFAGCDEDRSFIEHYRRLLAHMQPEQRLIAVPETWAKNAVLERDDWPEVLLARLRHHYEIALSEPRFVAFVPFIWSFDADVAVPGLGLDRFPELYDDGVADRGTAFVAAVLEMGASIREGRPAYPNMAWAETEASPARPLSRVEAAITAVSRDGVVTAWAVDRGLSHKNLRVQLRVYDRRGRPVHKSPMERTFLRDESLADRAPLGLHGYQYTLPANLLRRYGARGLDVRLYAFADGLEREVSQAPAATLDPPRQKPRR